MIRIAAATFFLLLLFSPQTRAHCDTMNGPVVNAGRLALESKEIRHALIWVQPSDEQEIRAAFEKTLAVRALGGDAKALADRYFFETLVRVHRAGEGAPYTGLKEGDAQPEPGIAAAEHALEAGSVMELSGELAGSLQQKLQHSFHLVQSGKDFAPSDVTAGRRYVSSYINYIHLVERLHNAIESAGAVHGAEAHIH